MPVTKSTSIPWPKRTSVPRSQGGINLPYLASGRPGTLPYVAGRSKFTISPLSITMDQLLFLLVAALLGIGVLMVQSADARVRGVSQHFILDVISIKNIIHACIALTVMSVVWNLDYRKMLGKSLVKSMPMVLMAVTLVCLLAVLSPLGAEINGAKRWLIIPGIRLSFQPSELAKWSLVFFVSAYAVHQAEKLQDFIRGFAPIIMIFGFSLILVVKEDFGTAALIAVVVFSLLLMSGCKWWHLAILIPPALAAAYFAVWHSDYRRARLTAFLNPEADPKGAGYHPLQSLLTIASGGLPGRGLGYGIQKMGFLPEDNTDFIFAVVCEELGFMGAGLVIALFLTLVFVGWRVSARCDNLFGKMISFGITAAIGLQAAINIAVVTVTVPTKGIALPFISSGGTGWIMTAAAVGVLMSIERINRLETAAGTASKGTSGFPVEINNGESSELPTAPILIPATHGASGTVPIPLKESEESAPVQTTLERTATIQVMPVDGGIQAAGHHEMKTVIVAEPVKTQIVSPAVTSAEKENV